MTFDISLASTSEWELVREVRLRSLREEPSAYCSTLARELAFAASDWQERLATAHTWLARDPAGGGVGLVTALWLRDGGMALTGMYVAPEVRGQGCAQGLIDAVVDLTRLRGGVRVVLDVLEDNELATRCYRAYGFEATGHRARNGDGGRDRVEYAYRLVDGAGDVSPRG